MRAIPLSLKAPLKTLLGRGLLALAFLFAQQHAALHWLSHAVEATHAKASQNAPAAHCDECLALAGLGAAATSSTPVLPAPFARHALTPIATLDAAPSPLRLGFQARAPPLLG